MVQQIDISSRVKPVIAADGLRFRDLNANGVRLANAIHLSSWTGREVSLDFDEDEYLSGLNQRIRDEGLFPQR